MAQPTAAPARPSQRNLTLLMTLSLAFATVLPATRLPWLAVGPLAVSAVCVFLHAQARSVRPYVLLLIGEFAVAFTVWATISTHTLLTCYWVTFGLPVAALFVFVGGTTLAIPLDSAVVPLPVGLICFALLAGWERTLSSTVVWSDRVIATSNRFTAYGRQIIAAHRIVAFLPPGTGYSTVTALLLSHDRVKLPRVTTSDLPAINQLVRLRND